MVRFLPRIYAYCCYHAVLRNTSSTTMDRVTGLQNSGTIGKLTTFKLQLHYHTAILLQLRTTSL